MASVLLCEDERLGRQVAVKRLHADSPVDVEQRFKREAKLGASLNHPNLVSVFDTATDDEGVLIVMEYVEGEPLSRALRRGPLRPEEVASMVRDLGDALDHAHAQGIVHRDVKPGNVLIREDGVSKLADLGIATASDGTKITRSGTVLGTAAYMAPEQLDGRGAGPPADVYALAAITFEALGGRRPREGATPIEIAHRIATEGPPDLLDVWPTAPKEAARVLKRGMALEPEDRPSSAGEFARELTRALEDAPEKTGKTRRFFGGGAKAAAAAAAPAAEQASPPPSTPTPPPTREPAPLPTPRHLPARPARRDHRGRGRPRTGAVALAAIFIALALAIIAGAVLSGGDDGGSSPSSADSTPAQPKPDANKEKKEPKAKKEPKEEPAAPRLRRAPAPTEEQSDSGSYDEARGTELNDRGFRLMRSGDYEGAVPVLQEAVDSFPPGTGNITYAYALFNLGKSLRLAGDPDAAIPILEQRLKIPNQTEAVQAELDQAKRDAGKG